MALPIGILLIIVGVVACIAWATEVIFFLKGFVAFSLLFWGTIALIVGFAQSKARREIYGALRDKPSSAESSAKEAAPAGEAA